MIRKIVPALIALALVALFLFSRHPPALSPIDRIVVEKSTRTLSIFRHGKKLKSYRIALGRNPLGPKEQEGDMKTPEGLYQVDNHKSDSDYHLALHISYPSGEDNARADARGVSAGCDIMIHGWPNGADSRNARDYQKDWTAGCIALTNEDIEELYRATPDGTMIEIKP